jgi:hypothetical protein
MTSKGYAQVRSGTVAVAKAFRPMTLGAKVAPTPSGRDTSAAHSAPLRDVAQP